jgi:hypothetical protein
LEKSQCLGIWLHRYKIVAQFGNAVEERCEICKDTKIFKLGYGPLNNLEYLDYHLREALPPQHPLYEHEHKKLNSR